MATQKITEDFLLKPELNQALKNYNGSENLKIDVFSENERYFINALAKSDLSTGSKKEICDFIRRRYLLRIDDFSNLPSLLNFNLNPNFVVDSKFNFLKIDNLTLEFNKEDAKKLKEKWGTNNITNESVISLAKILKNSKNYYDPDQQKYFFDCLSPREKSFIESFKEWLLKENNPVFIKLNQKLHEQYITEIKKTGLDIQIEASLDSIGKLILSDQDIVKLKNYYSKMDRNPSGYFVSSPISQPTLGQQKTAMQPIPNQSLVTTQFTGM